MRLTELTAAIPGARLVGEDREITRLDTDTRKVQAGSLFICYPGVTVDRHDLAPDAVRAGAAALITERVLDTVDVPQIVTDDARAAWSYASAAWFGYPQRKLTLIGVTGTKGKTTTAFLIKHIMEASGHKCGLIGTVATYIGAEKADVHFATATTPDPQDLQSLFALMAEAGCDTCVMEVSAHALALRKLKGLKYAVGAFTNLSEDHLDDFKTMERYGAAKALLFTEEMLEKAVVNADDEASESMLAAWHGVTYRHSAQRKADSYAVNVVDSLGGIRFDWVVGEKTYPVAMQMGGAFNVQNALTAATSCLAAGADPAVIARALGEVEGVDGRLERVNGPMPYTVIVDYAHSPDSLENVLKAVRPATRGRLICVFGCGGNRDPFKRPVMGRIGTELADTAILTTDNPRFEDPDEILDAVEAGAREAGNNYTRVTDRTEAIHAALDMAGAGDTVLICGKGHETYQEIRGVKHDYDDRAVVRAYLGLNGTEEAKG